MRSPSLPGWGPGSFWGLCLVLLVQENSVSVVLTLALPLRVLPRRLWDGRGQSHVPQNLGPSSPLEAVNWGHFTDGQSERGSLGCVHVGRGRFGHGHTDHEKATWTEASSRDWKDAAWRPLLLHRQDGPALRAQCGRGPWALRKPTQSLPADSGVTDPPAGPTSLGAVTARAPTGTLPLPSARNPSHRPPRAARAGSSRTCTAQRPPLTAARGLRLHTRVFRVFKALGTHAHEAPGRVVAVLVLARAGLLGPRTLVYVCERRPAHRPPSPGARARDSLLPHKCGGREGTRRARGSGSGPRTGRSEWAAQAAVKGEARRELTPRGQPWIHRLFPGGFQPGPDRGGLTCSHGGRGGGRWGEARAPAGGRTRTRHSWGLPGQTVGAHPLPLHHMLGDGVAGRAGAGAPPPPAPHGPSTPWPPATVHLGLAQTQGR